MVKILFFAHLSEMANTRSLDLHLGKTVAAVDIIEQLKSKVPEALIKELNNQTAMVSINQSYATWQSQVSDGDELAFLPPVSGG